ncbi:DNA-directed RNA polymerase subunit H [Candidatus Micrarchaeota archaeon]|nr:DNA-directed RNA polymerase subunit H [Candidatus Micrarchaeota archaeon]
MDVLSYHLVPKMEILGETEKNRILQKYGIESTNQLPKLRPGDAAVAALGAKAGDVIKIHREDKTGKYAAYKVVKEK